MSRPKKHLRVPPIYPARRKVCPMCERDLPWTAFYPRARADTGHVLKVRSKCKACEHEIASERWQGLSADEKQELLDKKRSWWHEQRATDPVWDEARRASERDLRRWQYATDPEFRERVKAKAREQKRDPVTRERHNEARRRRAAAARAERAREAAREFPIGPLRDWIQRTGLSDLELGERAGVSARLIYKVAARGHVRAVRRARPGADQGRRAGSAG